MLWLAIRVPSPVRIERDPLVALGLLAGLRPGRRFQIRYVIQVYADEFILRVLFWPLLSQYKGNILLVLSVLLEGFVYFVGLHPLCDPLALLLAQRDLGSCTRRHLKILFI